MKKTYNPNEVEEKWQKIWDDHASYRSLEDESREKYYLLEMFPYPSGNIHMGHVRNYSIGDVVARFKMMRGYNVIHPMGWDSFGLPAENAAIQHGIHPAKWTRKNIDYMRQQLKRMGFSYDWEREVATCDVTYYKWEQLFFLKLLEKGLVYRKVSLLNWCESCQTVLANEQVENGNCWRCSNEINYRELPQWFFKITDYAEELLEGLGVLKSGWPERVLTMQRNWIGRSEGAEIDFPVDGDSRNVKVFTTRQDTLFGATFMSLAPEHPLVAELVKGGECEKEVLSFVESVKREDSITRTAVDYEKRGVFTGRHCINPVNGRKIPVYVANFVLMEYGTGAVMAVPAHDQRDFEFAKKYDISVVVVIQPKEGALNTDEMEAAYIDDGVMVNSGEFDGLQNREAMKGILELLESKNIGKRAVSYRLKDWGISRQRYWGVPIPVIYCEACGVVPVPEGELPVTLPTDIEFIPSAKGSPLALNVEFYSVTCPKCGGAARRETDTMDTFVDSSWYFLRYLSPESSKEPFSDKSVKYWMPVDQYIGGIEHACMHLLYARFFTKVLRDLGLVEVDEPFSRLLTQGMVIKDGAKMSKSKGNVVDPEELIAKYGADTARLFSLFAAPPERDLDWSDQGVEGCYRFLNRVWRLVQDNIELIEGVEPYKGDSPLSDKSREIHYFTHKTIKKVTEDVEDRFHFNTAVSAVMELVNTLYQWEERGKDELNRSLLREALESIILLLSPFVPHLSSELWETIGGRGEIEKTAWPAYNEDAVKRESVVIAVQVNGKVRANLSIAVDAAEDEVKEAALDDPKVSERVEGKELKRVIYIPGRIINIVVA